jgi:D-tyrosyl-tRNA(Tyr) deacylase
MRAVIQRVRGCEVAVAKQESFASIDSGLLVLLGVGHADRSQDARWLAEKTVNLRVFEDDHGKMNLSLIDIKGEMLVVSQFTLLGDCRKGRRPSFAAAAKPQKALSLYYEFIDRVVAFGVTVKSGQFGAHMEVTLTNDGPVTLIVSTNE